MRLARIRQASTRESVEEQMVHACLEKRAKGGGQFGLYATASIAEGTEVLRKWHEEFYSGLEGWAQLTTDEVLRLPAEQKELFLVYGLDVDFCCIVGPLHEEYVTTLDNFVNHSCEPNLRYDLHGNVVAARPIAPDEELLIDYGFFAVNFDETFDCQCRSTGCRGRLTKNDWRSLALRYGYAMPRFLHMEIANLLGPRELRQSN